MEYRPAAVCRAGARLPAMAGLPTGDDQPPKEPPLAGAIPQVPESADTADQLMNSRAAAPSWSWVGSSALVT
jgi:hypothetical protein